MAQLHVSTTLCQFQKTMTLVNNTTATTNDTDQHISQELSHGSNKKRINVYNALASCCLSAFIACSGGAAWGFTLAAAQDLINDAQFFWQHSEPAWVGKQ